MKKLLLVLALLSLSFAGFTQTLRTIETDIISPNAAGSTTIDIDSGVTINSSSVIADDILDEDDLASDSATALITQQSVKAYVDAAVTLGVDDLTDVTITGPTTNDILSWNGSAWVDVPTAILDSVTIGGALDGTSVFDVASTTKGSRPCPSMTETQRNAITTPATGLCVFNSTTSDLNIYNGSSWGELPTGAGGGISEWVTGTGYVIGEVVHQSNHMYLALTNHTSGTFATDLAANEWIELTDGLLSAIGDVTITSAVTNDVLTWNGSAWINSPVSSINEWVTGTDYLIGNIIYESNHIYLALTDHTSGTFATDLAANEWIELTDGLLSAIGDVTITTPASGDLLTWTGAAWENVEYEFNTIGTPTYSTPQEYLNGVQSSGIISGGEITDSGSGEVDIAAITGIIKSTNSAVGVNYFFDIALTENQTLTDNSINYIYVTYNAGTPALGVATSNTANGRTIFNVGKVYREGTNLDVLNSGLRIDELTKRIQQETLAKDGIYFTSGGKVSETGTRNIAISAGVIYAGMNPDSSDAFDSSGTDTFEYYYYDGAAWQESDQSQIDNTQYNDIATGLETLSNNKYGVHWIYKGTNGNTYVLYGQGNYTLAQAEATQYPETLPSHVSEMGVLRARIIIEKDATTFTDVGNVDDETFIGSGATSHDDLLNVDAAEDGVTDGHITDATQTIAGAKTFEDTIAAEQSVVDTFIPNATLEVDATGWVTYDDGTDYVDGTGGTPTVLTATRRPVATMWGAGHLDIENTTGNCAGEGVSVTFEIPPAMQANKLVVKFLKDGSGANFDDGDLEVYFYDITNSKIIQPVDRTVYAGENAYVSTFQTSPDSVDYRMSLHCTATTGAFDFYADNFEVNAREASYGVPTTDWEEYTSTVSNVTGTSTFTYKQNGDSIDILGNIKFTGSASGDITFTLPSGLSLDSSKIPYGILGDDSLQVVGEATGRDTSPSGYWNGSIIRNVSSLNSFLIIGAGGYQPANSAAWTTTIPMTWASGDNISISIQDLPIVGWSSNSKMSSSVLNADVVADYYGSSTAVTTTRTDVVFITKVTDTVGMTSDNTNYIIPVSDYYDVSFAAITSSFQITATGSFTGSLYADSDLIVQGVDVQQATATRNYWARGSKVGVYLEKDTIVKLTIASSSGSGTLGTGRGTFLSIKKSASPQTMFEDATIGMRYQNTAGSSLPASGTIYSIPFATKIEDTHNIFDGSATATIPVSGWYHIDANLSILDPAANTTLVYSTIYIVPSVATGVQKRTYVATADNAIHSTNISKDMYLTKGETVIIKTAISFTGTGTAPSLYASVGWNDFSITRIK